MSPESTTPAPQEYLRREYGARPLKGGTGRAIVISAASWSLFQLALAHGLLLNAIWVRAIHLAFALALVYLSFPAIRSKRLAPRCTGWRKFLVRTDCTPTMDRVLALLAVFAALYLVLDYEGVSARQGIPIGRDLLVGGLLVILLLEAARRALGPALPSVAGIFILYSFFSEYMPAVLATRNASLSKVINKLCMADEGIYGVPLGVSASVVFLFVLFGSMLEKAGGGQYFIDLAYSALGRYRGGPAKAAVLASGLTGMVNGSSIANTVTTGTFTIPLMKRAGFSGIKAGAIEVAASTNGQLMPPIMGAAAFIIAEYCNMPYLAVVRAAFIPAVISYLALIYITHLEALKLDLQPLPRSELPRFGPTFIRGIHFLVPLAFLIHQLVRQRASAERSAYFAILALAALVLIREVIGDPRRGWIKAGRILLDSLVAGARNMMRIGVAVAAAGIIVGIVTLGLGGAITELIGVLSGGNLLVMLLITAFVSLILGMGLPTTANYIVMASLTVPAIITLADQSGFVLPLIAAHLFCFYFGILSDDTPPVGLSAYAAAAISGEDPIRTGIQGFKYDIRTAILPFMFVFNTDLLLIDVHGFWPAALVFATGLLALFAFAALTQGFLLRKNRWYEGLLLGLCTLILLRYDFFAGWVPAIGKYGWYSLGALIFAGVHALQWRKASRTSSSFSVSSS